MMKERLKNVCCTRLRHSSIAMAITPPNIAVRQKNPEAIARPGDGADRCQKFHITRASGPQQIEREIKSEAQPEPGRRVTEPGPAGGIKVPYETCNDTCQHKPVRYAAIADIKTRGYHCQHPEKNLGSSGQRWLCQHRCKNEYSVNLTEVNIKKRHVNHS